MRLGQNKVEDSKSTVPETGRTAILAVPNGQDARPPSRESQKSLQGSANKSSGDGESSLKKGKLAYQKLMLITGKIGTDDDLMTLQTPTWHPAIVFA